MHQEYKETITTKKIKYLETEHNNKCYRSNR